MCLNENMCSTEINDSLIMDNFISSYLIPTDMERLDVSMYTDENMCLTEINDSLIMDNFISSHPIPTSMENSQFVNYMPTYSTPPGVSYLLDSQVGIMNQDYSTISAYSKEGSPSQLVDQEIWNPKQIWDKDLNLPAALVPLEKCNSSNLGTISDSNPNLNLSSYVESIKESFHDNMESSIVSKVSLNKPAKIVVNKVSKLSISSNDSVTSSGSSIVIRLPNRRQFSPPPSSQIPGASELFHCEDSGLTPFVWKVRTPLPLKPLVRGGIQPTVCISAESHSETIANPNSEPLRFPKSFFHYFKSLPNFPKTKAGGYFLDSISALRDCISENPPMNPTIFHNAGLTFCCKREPPSQNSCMENRDRIDLKCFLDNLPKDSLRDKLYRWWNSDQLSPPPPPAQGAEPSPQDFNFSEPSDYYISSYCASNPVQFHEIPDHSIWEFMIFTALYIVQFLGLYAFQNLGFLPLSTLVLFFGWGRGSIKIFNSYLEILGFFIEIFLQGLESAMKGLYHLFPRFLRILNNQSWIKRFRGYITLRFYDFLTRFQTIFLQHSHFQTKILYHKNLRHITSYICYNKRSDRSSARRYRVKKLTRGKNQFLQLLHVRSEAQPCSNSEIKIDLEIKNNVPLISTLLGRRKLNMIVDSGAPVNVIPQHILKTFEDEEGIICTKFEHTVKLRAHTATPLSLCNYGALIPFNMTTSNNIKKEVYLPFIVEKTNSDDILLGLPSISSLNVNLRNKSVTININKSLKKIIPTSPVPVIISENECMVPSEIPLVNGIYNLCWPAYQTFHDEFCSRDHDPRIKCRSNQSNGLNPYKNSDNDQCHGNIFYVQSNKLECLPVKERTDISSTFSSFGTLEYVSKTSKFKRGLPDFFRPEKDGILPSANTSCDEMSNSSTDEQSNLPFKNNLLNAETSEIPENPDLNCTDGALFTDIGHVNNNHLDEDYVTNKTYNYADLCMTNITNLNNTYDYACVHFVSNYPDFKCIFSSAEDPCSCQHLKNTKKLKSKFKDKNSSNIIYHVDSNGLKHFYFSMPNFSDISMNPKLVLLVQLMEKFSVSALCMNIPSHSAHPFLPDFYRRLILGFQNVVLSHPKTYKLFATLPISLQPEGQNNVESNVHKLTVVKNINMRGCDSLIPDEVLNESEAIPFLSVNTFDEDFSTFLTKSGKEEKEFLTALLTEYKHVASQSPIDIGKVTDPEFIMDIKLLDENAPLPLEVPFNTTLFKKVAASKIVQNWIDSKIVVKSNIRTHASRLVIASKHLNDSDFAKIIDRLKNELNLDYSELDKSQINRINPSILTAYEVSKCYRLCLDAKALNAMTKPETVFSANPDVTISELMFHDALAPDLILDSPILDRIPANLKKFVQQKSKDDDKLFYSCLDIRGAHNSVTLSPKSSEYLNTVLPNWDCIKFISAPFGLRNIGSHWNYILSTILKELIEKGNVVLYADDILIICRGRAAHRLVLSEVFRIFAKHGIKLSLNKCEAFVDEFHFLGFKFSRDGINLTDERVQGITNIKAPRNIREVQRLLGCTVYVARFIPDLQLILTPISDLLKASIPFSWNQEHQDALDKIKLIITNNLKLSFIDSTKPLSLYCDSSKLGGGACLFQEDVNKVVKPICFFSRKYNKIQTQHLSALECEIINILDSLHRLRAFVNCTTHPINIVTDAKALIFLLKSSKEGSNPKLLRLASRLTQYDLNFTITYEKPLNNSRFLIADFLSRSRGEGDMDLKFAPMKSFRCVQRSQINHNLTPGSVLTYSDLLDAVQKNDSWFTGYFPTQNQPFPPCSRTSNQEFEEELDSHASLAPPQPCKHLPPHIPCSLIGTFKFGPNPPLYPSYSSPPPPNLYPVNDLHLEVSDTSDILDINLLESPNSHPNPPVPETIHKLNIMKFNLSIEEIVKNQQSDDYCKEIIDELRNKDLVKNSSGFFLKNHILHKLKNDALEIKATNSLIVIPSKLLPELIGNFHVSFGHCGKEKLWHIMRDIYYSPKLSQKIGQLTSGCHLCQINKPNNLRLPPLIQSRLALYPNSQYCLDFCHVPHIHGFKLILICIDAFSGFLFTRPCKSENSAEVCNLLKSIFRIFGPPKCIKSDNGSSLLRSKQVKSFLALWGVEKISLSLPFSPTHNAKCERTIRSIRALIRALCPNKPTGWFKLLEILTYVYNVTPRHFQDGKKSLLVSPFELFTRRKPTPLFPTAGLIADPLELTYFEESKKDILEIEKFVTSFLNNQNKLNLSRMNKYARKSNLNIGDLVLLRDLSPPQPGRLAKKHLPAFKSRLFIIRFLKDHLAVLEDPLTSDVIFQSIRYIKKYKGRDEIFNDLSAELREIMGRSFTPLNFSSREELKNFINSEKFVKDLDEISVPSSERENFSSTLTKNSVISPPKDKDLSASVRVSSISSLQRGVSSVDTILNNDKLDLISLKSNITGFIQAPGDMVLHDEFHPETTTEPKQASVKSKPWSTIMTRARAKFSRKN